MPDTDTDPHPDLRPTDDDHRLAVELARQAGELLVELRSRRTAEGAEPKDMKDEGDLAAHELLMAELAPRAAAGDAVLSEEGRDDLARLDHRRVWIVDPLDGTREFGEPPRTDWAVHVALAIDGVAVAGAVALPALDLVLGTSPAAIVPPAAPSVPRVIVSRSRPPAAALHVAAALGAELVEMGSAGAKAMAVIRGEADVYVHSGGQYEWDSCAPVAVAAAAGLHTSRIDGSPLVYNREDAYLPDLLICRPELAGATLEALATFGG